MMDLSPSGGEGEAHSFTLCLLHETTDKRSRHRKIGVRYSKLRVRHEQRKGKKERKRERTGKWKGKNKLNNSSSCQTKKGRNPFGADIVETRKRIAKHRERETEKEKQERHERRGLYRHFLYPGSCMIQTHKFTLFSCTSCSCICFPFSHTFTFCLHVCLLLNSRYSLIITKSVFSSFCLPKRLCMLCIVKNRRNRESVGRFSRNTAEEEHAPSLSIPWFNCMSCKREDAM